MTLFRRVPSPVQCPATARQELFSQMVSVSLQDGHISDNYKIIRKLTVAYNLFESAEISF